MFAPPLGPAEAEVEQWFEFGVEVSSVSDVRQVRSAIERYRGTKELWMWLSVTGTVSVKGQAFMCLGQTLSRRTDIDDTEKFLVQQGLRLLPPKDSVNFRCAGKYVSSANDVLWRPQNPPLWTTPHDPLPVSCPATWLTGQELHHIEWQSATDAEMLGITPTGLSSLLAARQRLVLAQGTLAAKLEEESVIMQHLGESALVDKILEFLYQRQQQHRVDLCDFMPGAGDSAEWDGMIAPRVDAEVLERFALEIEPQVHALKAKGNALFRAQPSSYVEAIDAYTAAADLCCYDQKLKAVLLSNRSLCHLKNKDYLSAAADARAALTLDATNSKAENRLRQGCQKLKSKESPFTALKFPPNPVPGQGTSEWERILTEAYTYEEERRQSGNPRLGSYSIPCSRPGGRGMCVSFMFDAIILGGGTGVNSGDPKDQLIHEAIRLARKRPDSHEATAYEVEEDGIKWRITHRTKADGSGANMFAEQVSTITSRKASFAHCPHVSSDVLQMTGEVTAASTEAGQRLVRKISDRLTQQSGGRIVRK